MARWSCTRVTPSPPEPVHIMSTGSHRGRLTVSGLPCCACGASSSTAVRLPPTECCERTDQTSTLSPWVAELQRACGRARSACVACATSAGVPLRLRANPLYACHSTIPSAELRRAPCRQCIGTALEGGHVRSIHACQQECAPLATSAHHEGTRLATASSLWYSN